MNACITRLLAAVSISVAAPLFAELPTIVAGTPPALVVSSPIHALRGNARVLIVFSPSANAASLHQQANMFNLHNGELADDNAVIVPVVNATEGSTLFTGENVPAGTPMQQQAERAHYGLDTTQFAVVLLDESGNEMRRWSQPVTVSEVNQEIRGNVRQHTGR